MSVSSSSFGPSPSGWYVEVVHPSGYVHRPATMDDPAPQRNPVANALPTISVPVRRSEKWSHPSFEDAEMRVWYDGQREPIDTLEEVEQTEQATVLRGRGGQELERRYTDEITQQPVDEWAREAISSTTGYVPHVDTPNTTREDGVVLDTAQRDGDWQTRLSPADTDPIVIQDGAVKLGQSCYLMDSVEGTWRLGSGSTGLDDPAFNGGGALVLGEQGDRIRFAIRTEYDIPAEHVGIRIRDQSYGPGDVKMRWDSTTLARLTQQTGLGWRELGTYSPRGSVPTYQSGIGADIRAGEPHTLEFEAQGASEFALDMVAVYDDRFSYTWPNPGSENGGGALAGPELYPQARDVTFDAPVPPRTVVGGRLRVGGRGVAGEVGRVGLSNTQGRDYGIESNTKTIAIDFGDPGPSLQPLVTLERTGDDPSRDRAPTRGYESQWLEWYNLQADLEDIPMVVNQSFDGSLVDVLSSVADSNNSIFEYRRTGPIESVEWTQPGQRTADRSPSVSEYEVMKSTAERVQKAVVYGGTRDATGVTVVVLDGEAGKSVDLQHSHLKQGTVTIESRKTGARMRPGDDYTVDHQQGILHLDPDGRMAATSEYDVSYSYQAYGEATLPDVETPRETVEESSGVTSNFAAQQTAEAVIDELREPVTRGTITVSGNEGFSVVEALAGADLPGGAGTGVGGIQIKEISLSPGEAELRVGSHRTFEEVVSDVESNISAVKREL